MNADTILISDAYWARNQQPSRRATCQPMIATAGTRSVGSGAGGRNPIHYVFIMSPTYPAHIAFCSVSDTVLRDGWCRSLTEAAATMKLRNCADRPFRVRSFSTPTRPDCISSPMVPFHIPVTISPTPHLLLVCTDLHSLYRYITFKVKKCRSTSDTLQTLYNSVETMETTPRINETLVWF